MKRISSSAWFGSLSVLLLILFTSISSPADESVEPPTKPLADLPRHIQAVPGKLTLVADFQNKQDGIVAMFLINATKAKVEIPTQDGDLYCKRTVQADDGRWVRCDSHQYSWCGNSYISSSLPAEKFLSWLQRCDTVNGTPRKIRFRLFQAAPFDLDSNEGSGLVEDTEIQSCRYDAMAMRDGPFEDVAAVATGKVKGGQRASIDGLQDALEGLARFPNESETFPVIKEVIANLARNSEPGPAQAYYYTRCLKILKKAMNSSIRPETCWGYAALQVEDTAFPWRNEALDWLVETFPWERNRLKPVMESVLKKPGHPAMRAAAYGYAKVFTLPEAGLKLAAMTADANYPASDQQLARDAREALYKNPFLSIDFKWGEPIGSDGEPAPLMLATITNISPQAITLPVGDAGSLLVISVRIEQGVETLTPVNAETRAGQLELPPGGVVEFRDFKWWTRLNPNTIKPDDYYYVSFQAASPGLWDVRAKPGGSSSFKGDKILQAIKLGQNP